MPRSYPAPSSASAYLTIPKAAHEFGVSYFQIYRWIERGLLKRVDSSLTGRSIVISRAELSALLERNLVAGGA